MVKEAKAYVAYMDHIPAAALAHESISVKSDLQSMMRQLRTHDFLNAEWETEFETIMAYLRESLDELDVEVERERQETRVNQMTRSLNRFQQIALERPQTIVE